MIDIPRVANVLDGLGATSAEVAATLANKGITGRPGVGFDCPIARYLTEQFPEAGRASVGNGSVGLEGLPHRITSPGAVQRFVLDFDAFRYPELLDPTPLIVRCDA